MIRFSKTLQAWQTADFEFALKSEIESLDTDQLPLQQGLSISSQVTDSPRQAIILQVSGEPEYIRVRAGIFYSGIISGCSCADDPTPVGEQTEYCEVQLAIHRKTAETRVTLLT